MLWLIWLVPILATPTSAGVLIWWRMRARTMAPTSHDSGAIDLRAAVLATANEPTQG